MPSSTLGTVSPGSGAASDPLPAAAPDNAVSPVAPPLFDGPDAAVPPPVPPSPTVPPVAPLSAASTPRLHCLRRARDSFFCEWP